MERTFCPTCMTRQDWHVENRIESYPVRGEPIEVEASVAVCAECGADLTVQRLEEETLNRAYDAYRRRHGIIRPEEIRQLREQYGLSQRAFARLLDWSPVQIHRYETGALPDSVHSDLLRALQNEVTMRDFVLEHNNRLSAREQKGVLETLDARVPVRMNESLHEILQLKMDAFSGLDRGFRQFDLDRMRQMVIRFTLGEGTVRNALLKKLWYADFLAFKRLSGSLSGTPYRAYEYGPVPNAFDLLLGILVDEDVIEAVHSEYMTAEGMRSGTEYRARVPFEASVFSEDELEILDLVSERFAGSRAKNMVHLSHSEDAWEHRGYREVIPYNTALSLSIE